MSGLRPPFKTMSEELTEHTLGTRIAECQAENDRLRAAVDAFRDLLMEIRNSRKGYAGHEVYCPHHMRRTRIDAIWNEHFQDTEDTHA